MRSPRQRRDYNRSEGALTGGGGGYLVDVEVEFRIVGLDHAH